MRVITGTARGQRLQTLPGNDTRPTAEMVKEALFSAVQFEIEGAQVLDLFAGSGQMGIEALSRGAAACTFVDQSARCCRIIKANLAATGLADRARVFCADAVGWLTGCGDTFDLVLIDPPYAGGMLPAVLKKVSGLVRPGGSVFCECAEKEILPELVGPLVCARQYRYGKIKIVRYNTNLN